MNAELLDHLKSLHTGAIDARNGYHRARDDADRPADLKTLFAAMADLHQHNAEELSARLATAGEKPDQEGSFMSVVHRTIMDVRSWFGGLDKDVLPGLIDGEERNVKAYDDTLELASADADICGLLSAQRTRLTDAILKMKAMRGTS